MMTFMKKSAKHLIRRTLLRHDLSRIGSLSEQEYEFLHSLVERANRLSGDFVEIGTLFGNTAQRLAAWKAPSKKVISVDAFFWNPWLLSPDEHERVTRNNLFYLTVQGHIEVVRADKNQFYRERKFAIPPALAFLDAVHTYEETRRDILWAQHAGVGIICGHDYSPLDPGVIEAVNEFGGAENVVGSVWTLRAEAQSNAA